MVKWYLWESSDKSQYTNHSQSLCEYAVVYWNKVNRIINQSLPKVLLVSQQETTRDAQNYCRYLFNKYHFSNMLLALLHEKWQWRQIITGSSWKIKTSRGPYVDLCRPRKYLFYFTTFVPGWKLMLKIWLTFLHLFWNITLIYVMILP